MKQVPINAFEKYISKSEAEALYLIYGEERFFHDIVLKQIDKHIYTDKAEKDLNYHLFYGTENNISEVMSACMSYPMLASRKLVVVKEFDKIKINDKDSFLKYIINPQKTTSLVLIAEQWNNTKFSNEILKNAISIKCKTLNSGEIYSWIKDKFKQSNIEAEKDSTVFLIENIGRNLLRLNLEKEKIINYLGEGKTLTLENVSDLIGFSREVNIFNFQKVLSSKNLRDSLKMGMSLLEQGDSMSMILPVLFNFFRKIWVVKQLRSKNYNQSQIVNQLGGNAYIYQDVFTAVNNFSIQQILSIIEKL